MSAATHSPQGIMTLNSEGHDVETPGTPCKKSSNTTSPPSPASNATSPLTPTTPASKPTIHESSSEKKRAPSPPRWRFVNDAKKSAGYNSLAAGHYVKGRSANELGAKYVPPDIAIYRHEKKEENVGKLLIREWKRPDEELPEGEFPGFPSFQVPAEEHENKFRQWDTKIFIAPKKNRENEWWDGEINDFYKASDDEPPEKNDRKVGRLAQITPDSKEEIFTGQFVLRKKPNDPNDKEIDNGDGNDVKELEVGATSLTIDGESNSVDTSDGGSPGVSNEKPLRQKRKECCLFILIILLLLSVIILGILLGKRSASETSASTAVVIPPIEIQGTTSEPSISSSNAPSNLPSFVFPQSNAPSVTPSVTPSHIQSLHPSLSPTSICSANNSALSINHFHQNVSTGNYPSYNATWKVRDVCSGEVIKECLPCSLGNLFLPGGNKRFVDKNHDQNLQNIIECFPSNDEYVFEIYPAYDSKACCGFDPATFTAFFGNGLVANGDSLMESVNEDGQGNSNNFNVVSSYFGKRESPCPTQYPSLLPTAMQSDKPSLGPSEKPSSLPSEFPSLQPSDVPTTPPSSTPTSHAPTKSPVVSIGGCPESFVPMSYYVIGTQIHFEGIVYECISYSCGTYGFDPGIETSSLWRQAWDIVGACSGTIAPTLQPTPPPTPIPTSMPSLTPSKSPTKVPTVVPTSMPTPNPTPVPTPNLPTTSPTCQSDNDFDICFAVDMSGSVCNGCFGSIFSTECLGCSLFCQSFGVSQNTCCYNFMDVVDFSKNMVEVLGESPADQSFSVVQFGTYAVLASGLSSMEQTLLSLDRLDYSGGATNHADAINLCQETLSSSQHPDRKKFIMLVTDGVPTIPEYNPQAAATDAADDAKDAGTFVIPVFISPTYDVDTIEFMSGLSSDGQVFDVSDFGSLDSLQDSLVNQVSCQS